MAQLVDKSIAITEDIGIRDAKKSDVEPGAILLFLQVAGFLFFSLMDGAVDLNRQTYLREEEVYDPSSTDHMLRVETASQYPVVERIDDSKKPSLRTGRMSAHPPCMTSDMRSHVNMFYDTRFTDHTRNATKAAEE